MSDIRKDILHLIQQNLTQDLPIEGLDPNDSLVLYGVDSLNFMRVVVEIENKYDFEFEDDDLNIFKFPTLQSLVDYVGEKIAAGGKS